jgi:L,D-peptidoglycan transpeptidase YkuD (ErfK/YbiS/YcfS/YnhG family)
VWFLDQPFYRSDRLRAIKTGLVFRPLQQNMGWCESPGSQHYNCKVLLPFRGAHESMWRDDNAYDIVISTSHNKRPRVRGLGSAIFFHLLREGADATAGCVALRLADMRKILSRCGPVAALVVWPPNSQFRSLPRTARCQL